ncbi:MAG: thioredoxin family protein [Desulfobacterales bacterium]|nr:thioredoxin family protein [Desulfobacterales bacterium]
MTFVEIGSVNCIPCRAMQPIMKAVEEEYKGQVKIVFHDVWTAEREDGCREIQYPGDSHAGFSGQGRKGILPARRILSKG